MRTAIAVSTIAIVACVLGGTASNAQPGTRLPQCELGREATLSGTIRGMNPPGKVLSTGVNKLWSFAVDVTGGDCSDDELLVELSSGAPPASCVEGGLFEVTGVVEEGDDYGTIIRDPKKLSCSPG